MKTYDSKGNLLGDTATAPAVTSPPPSTAIAAPAALDFSALLQPPLVYFLVIGIGIAAYLYERNRG